MTLNPSARPSVPDLAAVAVVIVNYRTPESAIEAGRSVLADLERVGGVLVLVDNASGDESAAALEGFSRDQSAVPVVVVLSANNGGFAAGVNLGVAAASAAHYLLLNSDAVAAPGAVEAMLAAARSAPDAAIVTPRIIDRLGQTQVSRFRRHSPLSEFLDGAQTGPVTRLFPKAETPIAAADWRTPPDWVSFAAVLIDARALDAAGPLDEDYFLYYEDSDYSLRVRSAGFGVAVAPDAVFTHEPGGSTGLHQKEQAADRLPAYYYRARNRYYRKFYGPAGPVAANLLWQAGRLIALARGLFGRKPPRTCKARSRDIWIGWRG